MLIFDSFPSRARADDFAEGAAQGYVDSGIVVADERRDDLDPFPFELTPPIVYVPRRPPRAERELEAVVKLFGGRFVGT